MKNLAGAEYEEAVKYMLSAGKVAEKALCALSKCGTVIVSNGEIIGEGYNAPPLDKLEDALCVKEFGPGKPKFDQTCCMHAEWRAVMDALRRNPGKIKSSTLYFTRVDKDGKILKSREPYCTVCSRLALDAGIAEFVLWHEKGICAYPTGEYNKLSYQYVHRCK